MKRKIAAIIEVDEDIAYKMISDGPVAYVENEVEAEGLELADCFIVDDDETDEWKEYINYLVCWAFAHQDEKYAKTSPVGFCDYFIEKEC